MRKLKLKNPDLSGGRRQTVLNVKYNFNWQLGYDLREPIKVTMGTRLEVVAHHDNSANNLMNSEPKKDVTWGELTSEEMMLRWFGVVVHGDAKPESIATYRPGEMNSPLSLVGR